VAVSFIGGGNRRTWRQPAADFGTTYSGYGYSFRDEYKKDHSKIYCNTDWKSGDGLVTTKTPTVILFDENGKFQSFGYEAETCRKSLINLIT
jgi:hypothetical protein